MDETIVVQLEPEVAFGRVAEFAREHRAHARRSLLPDVLLTHPPAIYFLYLLCDTDMRIIFLLPVIFKHPS